MSAEPRKFVTITLDLPDEVVAQIEALAKAHQMTVSEVASEILKQSLRETRTRR